MAKSRPDAPAPFEDLYDRAVEGLLDVSVTDAWVETTEDRTHVLTVGDPTDPSVVVFQGGNVTNPVTLAWFQGLADEYHLVAPDTPGQPGETALPEPADYGPWAVDVLDGLGIDRAPVVGVSHGGGVLLELAAHAPDRVGAAALVVPAGFGTHPSLALVRIVALSLAYRLVPRCGLLTAALAPMFTEPIDAVEEVVVETIGTALRTADLRAEFPGPDDPSALDEFRGPTLAVLGERDPFFPADRIRPRVDEALPSPVEYTTLENERHFLSPTGRAQATEAIRSFLAGGP